MQGRAGAPKRVGAQERVGAPERAPGCPSPDPQLPPDGIHPFLDAGRHGDGGAPFAGGLAGPLVGGVDAHLRAQAADG